MTRPASLLGLVTLGLCGSMVSAGAVGRRSGEQLVNFGVVIFPGLDPQDVIGPVEPLGAVGFSRKMDLFLIAETMNLVPTGPVRPEQNMFNSSFYPTLVPTHTFATAPDLDVLIVPGGLGARSMDITQPAVDYIREVYPSLKYLITICTGTSLAARAGVLDGKRATTNKAAWAWVTSLGPHVKWVAPARWIVDGNVWTSTGVTAGIDLTHAFIKEMFGEAQQDRVASVTEYIGSGDHCADPWGVRFNLSTVEKCQTS